MEPGFEDEVQMILTGEGSLLLTLGHLLPHFMLENGIENLTKAASPSTKMIIAGWFGVNL
jgi:hypothetical protein